MFREYDIRGIYPTELNEDIAYLLGRAFATKLFSLKKEKTIVGYAMIRPDGKENLEIIFSTGPSILLEDFGRIAFLSKTRQ